MTFFLEHFFFPVLKTYKKNQFRISFTKLDNILLKLYLIWEILNYFNFFLLTSIIFCYSSKNFWHCLLSFISSSFHSFKFGQNGIDFGDNGTNRLFHSINTTFQAKKVIKTVTKPWVNSALYYTPRTIEHRLFCAKILNYKCIFTRWSVQTSFIYLLEQHINYNIKDTKE